MASPTAYEKPTLTAAWQAFLLHVPTMLSIFVATVIISFVGFGFYALIYLIASGYSGESVMADSTATLELLLTVVQLAKNTNRKEINSPGLVPRVC